MKTWQTQLEKLASIIGQLPEPLDAVCEIHPPSGSRWPAGVPSSPVLMQFYKLCDGGAFGPYSFKQLAELSGFQAWDDDDEEEGDEEETGRYVSIGDNQFGHELVWDSVEDRVGYHDLDGADGFVFDAETGDELMGRPMQEFLNGLFTSRPCSPKDEVGQMWRKVLALLD